MFASNEKLHIRVSIYNFGFFGFCETELRLLEKLIILKG